MIDKRHVFRRMLFILLIPMIALACIACKPKGAKDGEKTITLWHIMNYEGPKEVLAAAVERFEKANPGVKVKVQTFSNDAYKTKLGVEMASGRVPDVFFTWGGGALADYAKNGRVRDLTADLAKDGFGDRFLKSPLSICSSEGKVYAVPLDLSCVPVWYNTEIFTAHDLKPPTDLAEFIRVCDTLRRKGITPVALGNKKQWPGSFYFAYLSNRIGGTQTFLDAVSQNGVTFTDPTFVDAGTNLQRLVDQGCFSKGFNGIDVGNARTQFLNGRAAMYMMGTWLVTRVKKENPEFLNKLDCFPFPSVAGGKGDARTVLGGVNCGFAISKACKHPELAVELLKELTSAQVAEEWVGTGRIPAVKVDAKILDKLPAASRKALALLSESPDLQPYFDQYLSPRLAEVHKRTTQELFAGTKTPEAAAEEMQKAAKEAE